MPRLFLLFATTALTLGPALADAPTISCADARAQVTAQGAAVVHLSPFIYDRFVTDRSFCAVTQVTRQAFVATRDVAYCPVGYRCEEVNITRFPR